MPYYIAPYVGAGTWDEPFVPRGSTQPGWRAIDLRPDSSRSGGGGLNACILYLPTPDPDPRLREIASHKEETVGATTRKLLRTRLGVIELPDETDFGLTIARLLTRPPVNGWKRLMPTGGRYEVHLDGLLAAIPIAMGASDNFNRANENPLAAPWTLLNGADLQLISNGVQAVTNSTDKWWYYLGATSSADQYSQVKIITENSGDMGPYVRLGTNPGVINAYLSRGTNSGETLSKRIGVTTTTLVAHNVDIVANDVGRVEAEGSTIRYLINGSLTAQATDTEITDAGVGVGFYIYTTTDKIDDWEGGDFVATPIVNSATIAWLRA